MSVVLEAPCYEHVRPSSLASLQAPAPESSRLAPGKAGDGDSVGIRE